MIKNINPKIEMIVSFDIQMTASIEYSDIALPANSWLEFEDLEHVNLMRDFLAKPERFLRHLQCRPVRLVHELELGEEAPHHVFGVENQTAHLVGPHLQELPDDVGRDLVRALDEGSDLVQELPRPGVFRRDRRAPTSDR